jgi:large subunit ribosomal protein L11
MAEKKIIDLLINGGQATAGPPLGPALGPLGLNIMSVVTKINELTKDYSGMRVPVKIAVNTDDKSFEVTVGTPTSSALIVSELNIEKGSATPNTEKVGNLTLDQVMRITKVKLPQLLSHNLKNGTKEILGTCISMGVTVDGKDPREIQKEIDLDTHKEMFSKGEQ